MNIFLLFLPFLLLQFAKAPKSLRSLPAALATVSLFTFLPLSLYPPLLILSLLNTIHYHLTESPLNPKLLKQLRHISSLKDSLKTRIILPILYLSLLSSILYLQALHKPPLYALYFLPTLLFCPRLLLPYPFYILTLLIPKKRSYLPTSIPSPQNERFTKPSPEYPLEKITTSFSGRRLFELPATDPTTSKRPHIVFLYLESFRSSSLQKMAPHFIDLAKEGIYFSNFYASASQTFKAMFATLYGLPPSFGPDFIENTSSIQTLPLSGLPELLKEQNYTNTFVKAGSHNFDSQGKFLKNHSFDHLYDEKDIKRAIPETHGTSWGVHDEYMYTFLLNQIKQAKSPLFLNAATVTNHHPFITPKHFQAKNAATPFEETMEYTDLALQNFITQLKQETTTPIHLYIMADHGYPQNHTREPRFSPSLDKHVTHIPFLVLPINCGKVPPQTISSTASQIDILPTLMDLYNLKGKNSALGSTLRRPRKKPQAFLLNESIKPISGIVSDKSYKTYNHYIPLYDTLYNLYKSKKISSIQTTLKSLDLSSSSMTENELNELLLKHPDLQSINLNNAMLIPSLDLKFPESFKSLSIENNLLITDEDFLHLPNTITSLSIKGCKNLTDKTLHYISSLPLQELSMECANFSKEALETLLQSCCLKKLELENAPLLSSHSYHHPLEEVILQNTPINDEIIENLSSKNLKMFLSDNCATLTDAIAPFLKNTSLEVLHLENATQLSDTTLNELAHLPIHTFYISKSSLTKSSIDKLLKPSLMKLFCIDCENLPEHLDESEGKEICFLKGGV